MAKNPKEKRYALFRVGQQSFWLWPFFEPGQPGDLEGKPINLGTNVWTALNKLKQNPEWQGQAQKWVEWFEEHKHESRSAQQLEQAFAAAKAALPDHSEDERCAREWKKIHAALDKWKL